MAIALKTTRSGFSLMELMIVIMIIGLLGGVLAPALNNALKKAKRNTTNATILALKKGITTYKNELGQLPVSLKNLIERPKSGDERVTKKWDGPYVGDEGITRVPEDAWGAKFHYKVTAGAKHPYELLSYGPDGSKNASDKKDWISAWDE